MTAHQIWVICAVYAPSSPRARKPTPLKCTNISSVCPCPRDRQHPRLSLHMEPGPWEGELLGPSPGSPGREKSPFKSIPNPTPAPCSPSAPREGAATSQARRIHENHLDIEPAKVAPHRSVGSSGDGNHSLCYHVCWCFLISHANQDSIWVKFQNCICLKHWLSTRQKSL